ncbi:MAG: FecR domain-containing protein [Bacteroidales bacterium]|nr:FecR domain-containing protein [Bacteroidales bacterium]
MKTSNNIEYWDLIAKYYSDECNQQEIDELLKWKNENIDNQILFNQIKEDLEIINLNKSMNKINVDSAWDKLRDRIQKDEQNMPIIEEEKSRFVAFAAILKYAAAVILLISVGFFSAKIYQNITEKNGMLEFASLNDLRREIVLPDGSTVILNINSKISYPNAFALNERRIELDGEAFFDVTKESERPFIIETNDAEVKVLGTSFNVNASIPGHKTEVFVETGLVQLSRKRNGDEKILIKPGNVGVLSTNILTKEKNYDKNIVAWKTKEIIFYEDNLKNVIETLNKVYNSDITCENQDILNLRYTSTFRDQDIDSILNVICLTFDLKTENLDDRIILIKHGS